VLKWIWLLVLAALVVVAARPLDISSLRAGIATASAGWLVLAVLAHMLIQPLGALQWRVLLPATVSVSYSRVLRSFALTSVANNTTNGIIGHSTGVALIAREPDVGVDHALSLLVLDQVCVGIAKLAVLAFAASRAPLPTWMGRGAWGIVAAIVALLLGVVAIRRWPALVAQRSLTIASPPRIAFGVASALGIRVAEAGGIAAVQTAFGIPCTVSSVAYVLAATTLASFVPVVPANVGTYEAAVFLALRQNGIAAELATVVSVVQHASQLCAALLPGSLLLLFMRRRTA
jgi:uncharacterized membrane protein YbhN (UPF0104 family)